MIFQRCCFCVSLRTGGLILGYMGIAIYLFYIGVSIFAFCNIDEISNKITPEPEKYFDPVEWKTRLEIVVACMLFINLINIIAASLLIVGIKQQNRHLLLPWLVCGVSTILFTALTTFSTLGVTHENIGFFIGSGVGICVLIYLWLCVLSLYNEISNEQNLGQNSSLLHNESGRGYNYQAL